MVIDMEDKIIKALAACSEFECRNCPYQYLDDKDFKLQCIHALIKDTYGIWRKIMKVKNFNFLPFDEWYKIKDSYYKESIEKYEVEIRKFFDYYAVFANFPLKQYIGWFDFDEKQDISCREKLEDFKLWYEDACSKVNEEFEEYIHTYIVSE